MKRGAGVAREERLQIMLTADELEAVDDFRFLHRMPSRAAAVRELFRLGLMGIKEMTPTRDKSSAYGVLRDGSGHKHKDSRGRTF